MTVILLTIVLFAIAMFFLSLGLLFGRQTLKGHCGGAANPQKKDSSGNLICCGRHGDSCCDSTRKFRQKTGNNCR